MAKERPKGNCRICGEYCKLTFEHVPPKATYNKSKVRQVKLLDIIKDDSIKPWEINKMPSVICQRGSGGFYLCKTCNNNMGAWYGRPYKSFIDKLIGSYATGIQEGWEGCVLRVNGIRPLPIFKQIISMFCDINPGFAEKSGFKDYLLDRENTYFDRDKYRVFIHFHRGNIERAAGITVEGRIDTGERVLVSEIASSPIGMVLYIDSPDAANIFGTDITYFSQYKYDELADVEINLNYLESNSWVPIDYRTKAEIEKQIEKSKSYLNSVDNSEVGEK